MSAYNRTSDTRPIVVSLTINLGCKSMESSSQVRPGRGRKSDGSGCPARGLPSSSHPAPDSSAHVLVSEPAEAAP